MRRAPLPEQVRAYAPGFLLRLTLILFALREIVGRRLSNHPTLAHIPLILWRRCAFAVQRAPAPPTQFVTFAQTIGYPA